MKTVLRGLLIVVVLTATAYADDITPTQVTLARKILTLVGLKGSIDEILPAMATQMQNHLLQIHPEMGKDLHQTLVALMPEFQQGEDVVFNDAARALAYKLSEADLQQALTFFESPAGQKYTKAQAVVLEALGVSGAAWRQKLTTLMLQRTREEMKKKGFVF